MLELVAQDIRYGARALVKTPAFAIVAIVSLALGVGANTAIASVVYSMLIKTLPYDRPDAIHSVEIVVPERRAQFASLPVTVQAFLDWRSNETGFSAMTALRADRCNSCQPRLPRAQREG